MIDKDGLLFLTAEEMAARDKEATGRFGVDVLALMENAGAAVALLSSRVLGGVRGKKFLVLAGKGNNGGDGLVAARRLCIWGGDVRVVLGCRREELRDSPARQLIAVDGLGIPVDEVKGDIRGADLVVDSLLGYNSAGNPRGPVASLISAANESGAPVLAVDLPSGLDATTGEPKDPCVRAAYTLTFGFPKTGFLDPRAGPLLGQLYCADISLPHDVGPGERARGDETVVRIW